MYLIKRLPTVALTAVGLVLFAAPVATAHDHGRPVNTKTPKYELVSPPRSVVVAPNSFFVTEVGLEPGDVVTFTAHGWGAVVHDMRPGVHTVREIATFTDTDEVFDVTAVI